jgi:hypothetical protein
MKLNQTSFSPKILTKHSTNTSTLSVMSVQFWTTGGPFRISLSYLCGSFPVFLLPCVGSGLPTGLSPIQVPYIYQKVSETRKTWVLELQWSAFACKKNKWQITFIRQHYSAVLHEESKGRIATLTLVCTIRHGMNLLSLICSGSQN